MRVSRRRYPDDQPRERAWAVDPGLMTPGECRIARERLGWTRERLAAVSGTNVELIRAYESSGIMRDARDHSETGAARLAKVQQALAEAGVIFAPTSPPPSGVWITPGQCKEARRLLGWTQERLAREAGVGMTAIRNFERTGRVGGAVSGNPDCLSAVRRTLEAAGIQFTDEQSNVRPHREASVAFVDAVGS
jgi:transcriptional regulator with XRE-family HTH domain